MITKTHATKPEQGRSRGAALRTFAVAACLVGGLALLPAESETPGVLISHAPDFEPDAAESVVQAGADATQPRGTESARGGDADAELARATRIIQYHLKMISDANREYAIDEGLTAGAAFCSIQDLVDLGYLASYPQSPLEGNYVQAIQVLASDEGNTPDGYPMYDGQDFVGDKVHPDLLPN